MASTILWEDIVMWTDWELCMKLVLENGKMQQVQNIPISEMVCLEDLVVITGGGSSDYFLYVEGF